MTVFDAQARSARRAWLSPERWRRMGILAMVTLGLLGEAPLARDRVRPGIEVPPAIIVAPGSETALAISITARESLPKTALLRLRGLPPSVGASEGHAVAPGVWAFPIASLAQVRLKIPAELAGKSKLILTLVTIEGDVLAEAQSALVVAPAASTLIPAQPTRKADPERVPPPVPVERRQGKIEANPALAPPPPPQPGKPEDENRKRALQLRARAERALAQGGIVEARGYLERAAELGLGEAALQLGATFDPAGLTRLGVVGIVSDPEAARRWYEEALRLGITEAGERLARLKRR